MSKLYSQGAKGTDVKEIQAALNYHIRKPATPLNPDGIFGPRTAERVRQFQQKAGLIVDGIVGPNTLQMLYARIVGVSVIYLKPIGPSALGLAPRIPLFPIRGLSVGGPPVGPAKPPSVTPPKPPAPKPKKKQTKSTKSDGFDVKSQVVLNPLADGVEKPKVEYKITLTQELPWPILLPKPAKLTFDIKSPPISSEYSISGKLKLPFTELKLPSTVLYKSGSLTPYFFTGAGIEQHGFGKLNAGAGAALKVKLLELPSHPYLPTISLSADGGYKYDINLSKRKLKGKGFFTGTVGLEWHVF